MTKENEDAIVGRLLKWLFGIATLFVVPVIVLIFDAGAIVNTMHQNKSSQDTVNIQVKRFEERQLQYDELNKEEIQHLGKVVSKIAEKVDTSDMPRKRK